MYKILVAWLLCATALRAEPAPVISLPFSTGHGTEADFTLTVRNPNGIDSITEVRLLIKHDINAANACYLLHYTGSPKVLLRNDADASWGVPVTFGTSGTAANSQCTVFAAPSAITSTVDTYTLKVHVHFKGGFAGLRRIWAQTVELTNVEASRWTLLGEWVVPEYAQLPPRVDRIRVAADVPEAIEMLSTPTPGSEPRVYRNGLLQAPVADYAIDNRKLLFVAPIRTGDFFQVEYSPLCSAR